MDPLLIVLLVLFLLGGGRWGYSRWPRNQRLVHAGRRRERQATRPNSGVVRLAAQVREVPERESAGPMLSGTESSSSVPALRLVQMRR